MIARHKESQDPGRVVTLARGMAARVACLAVIFLAFPLCTAAHSQAFSDYFQPVDTIALSPDVLIGKVYRMDVDADGRMLILDRSTFEVSLFESDGRFIRTLSVEACNPGFEMHPIGAYFNGDEIFLTNSGIWGFRFNSDGTCKGPVDDGFRPEPDLAAVPTPDQSGTWKAGDIFLLDTNRSGHQIQRFDHTGAHKMDYPLRTDFARYVSRTSMGSVNVVGDEILVVRPHRPTALVYSLDGPFLREIGTVPDNFRALPKDIDEPEGDLQQKMKAIASAVMEYSSVFQAGLINDSTMVVQYTGRIRGDKRKPYVYAYNLDGVEQVPPVVMTHALFYIGQGRVYTIDTSRLDAQHADNPDVVVYELR